MKSRPQVCVASALFRVYVCGLAVMTWFISRHEPRSLYSLIAASDEGRWLLWAMLACGIVGLVDVLINDTAVVPLRLEWIRTHRHFGFASLAFCYVAELFIAVLKLASPGLALFCLWNALLVVTFSLIDAHQRSKDATCLQACN
ncbi:hypothetical protein [Burkholderia ubonensis]|uniref:Uncharacterized protein n=1 Tax=Burkholderia ubonensis TaxID=101571 RepID=A0ABD4DZT0_9BURK|nr:hypothetical protein [Burkholderia ubonensis]KVN83488.1 hypothetical protein WJ68_16385 [Burkholderia ubonensis]